MPPTPRAGPRQLIPPFRTSLAGFLADVARAVTTLLERQSAFAGRLVGVEASQRTLTEGANSAVA
eukprot:9235984-Alexandrium_andersonii.AAC.1